MKMETNKTAPFRVVCVNFMLTVVCPVTLLLVILSPFNLFAADFASLGSGDPRLKVATKTTNANAIVIYQDEQVTAGIGGLGGMQDRTITVVVDHGFHFRKNSQDIRVDNVPLQLFPFDCNSAFTSEIGAVDPNAEACVSNGGTPPWSIGYRLENGRLTTFTNVQTEAAAKYHLNQGDIFLGCINSRVFFCKNRFHPAVVFCRDEDNQHEFYFKMPRKVVDIFGVTRGVQNDFGFVVLQGATWHLHPSPYEKQFIELSFSNAKPMASSDKKS
jgi:hypothetical protein